jgi:hypothetical protein
MPAGWDRRVFLEALARGDSAGVAAREAGMSRQMAYLERDVDESVPNDNRKENCANRGGIFANAAA